ncbi:flagellar basal-body MS-ring/collar protein FliF [Saccharibacillus sp. CPCC 101409]|uniref:flagellar basal-body MS-ring/collar protein FliF n=1 Tax=Saccharibacillus sp. CPCC 101409 TaxID=3058041 RepID=UPI002670FFD6|nr:flagellar basal-body MS-ring/collar protein FliF [Saccharibacillus sp. CPCC 101409]MDO3410704.1 flagellar basal-body MS-ring/collar protein FliF [Saccharibacillus sp. CPCC 101409]
MNERLTRIKDSILGYWNRLSKTQKGLLISTVVITLLTVVILTMQFSKTEYEVAFQDLNSEDAAAAMTYLDSAGIPYKLSEDGTSLSVPSTNASRVRVDVASQGIIQNGSIGFNKMFGTTSSPLGMTDSEFNVKYNSALNGEIASLLQLMNGVKSAKVLVNLPKESLFAASEDQDQASASVVMTFKPGFRPSQDVIDGYFNLIKTSVPNLPIENISITSDNNTLYASNSGAGGGVGSAIQDNLAIQRNYESGIEKSVKMFLGSIVGADKVNVLVASKLNFDQVNATENTYTPVDADNMKGIEISVQDVQESYTGAADPSSGVAGTGTESVPTYPGDTTSGQTSSESSNKIVNYQVNQITKQIVQSPYIVKDLTINVAIEPADGATTVDENVEGNIKTILANIIGASLADSGTTYNQTQLLAKVSIISSTPAAATAAADTGISRTLLWGIIAAAVLIVAALVFVILRRRRNAREDELLEEMALPIAAEMPSINLDTVSGESQMRKQLESLAKKKPDEFVNLLRTWLADE